MICINCNKEIIAGEGYYSEPDGSICFRCHDKIEVVPAGAYLRRSEGKVWRGVAARLKPQATRRLDQVSSF